jgi:hypothetical protein
MNPEIAAVLLASMSVDRLVVFTGAGLSMAPPSDLPSAQVLAGQCAARHTQQTGESLPADECEDIEALARMFFGRGELENYFAWSLVDWRPFRAHPNPGHAAVADFLACRAIQFSVSTNMDSLVEVAAAQLGERDFTAATNGDDAALVRPHSPLLKLHGCCVIDRRATLWCNEQIAGFSTRLEQSTRWLDGQLRERDVLIVGYWTDWGYLNSVLEGCLGSTAPRVVVLVDPAEPASLEAKAPRLWAWANQPGVRFYHEPISGADFLDELRRRFSSVHLKTICEAGRPTHVARGGSASTPTPQFSTLSSADLYDLRRDFCGVSRLDVPRCRTSRSGARHGSGIACHDRCGVLRGALR